MKRALVLVAAIAALPVAAHAQVGQVVGPNGTATVGNTTDWISSEIASGSAQVTTNAPRLGFANAGSGSLELSVTGGGNTQTGFPDWAFMYRYAGGSAAATINGAMSFGNLQEMTSMSFDWYRTAVPGWDAVPPVGDQPINPVDWKFKTPVVRLQLVETRGDQSIQSELVWEGYYNQSKIGAGGTPVGTWVSQTGMQDDNFWYVRPSAGAGGTQTLFDSATCLFGQQTFWSAEQGNTAIGQLFGANGCMFGANVQVIGIAVGVGSQWPVAWHGFADNVRMGFNDQLALDANFDYVAPLVVPEPGTFALLGLGLIAFGAAARRRRRA